MTGATITDEELAALIARTEDAADAYVRGDVDAYLARIHHAPGYTLMNPLGGAPVAYENRAESVRASAGSFTGGEARLEVAHAHRWGDTVVLAMIERQHAQVGGLPDHDCSLRVTLVFRREGESWRLVHRHADPLVHPIDLAQAAALIQG